MKTQTIGMELEFTGITRAKAIKVIASYFGANSNYDGGSYDAYSTTDSQGRTWKVVSDSSIRTEGGEKCEMVTPICKYEDIETIQEIVRKLRKAGAKVNNSCGIHIHIGKGNHTAQTLKNLTNLMASKEDLIFKALQVDGNRERYCKKAEKRFIEAINAKRKLSIEELERIWYNGNSGARIHYDDSRYHALNLHSVFSKGTIEFRLFNATLHAGKIKSYIQLVLAMNQMALTAKSANRISKPTDNDKFTFRVWLNRLGLKGDEFKTARFHLLAELTGNSAFRYGRAAA